MESSESSERSEISDAGAELKGELLPSEAPSVGMVGREGAASGGGNVGKSD